MPYTATSSVSAVTQSHLFVIYIVIRTFSEEIARKLWDIVANLTFRFESEVCPLIQTG
jgi:hypothetical protein